nr:hypothetical protein [Zobellia laminariae]
MRQTILSLFFLVPYFVFCQNIKFKTLSTDDGLSNNSVNDIISDKDGVLWIATWDGLNLYDGHNFTVYKHIQNDSTSIFGNVIIKFLKDVKDNIWILTDNKSVSTYTGKGKFKNYVFKNQPEKLLLSKTGELIVKGSEEGKYYKFKKDGFVESSIENVKQRNHTSLYSILLSKHPHLIINESLQDSYGNIWYATKNKGLYVIPNNASNINNEDIEHYEYDLYSPYSFTSNEIEKLYEDSFGNIWLGHKDGGLSMAYKGSQQINTITPHPIKFPNLPNETIRAITKDFNNAIWLGYYTQGLFYYSQEHKSYIKYEIPKQLKNNDWDRIRSLFTSTDGSIWAGTYAGLIRIKDGKSLFYKPSEYENFPNGRNYSLFEDNKKQLWISCWSGLAKFNLNTEKFEAFEGQEDLIDFNIRNVTAIEDEVLLSSEDKGAMLLNTTTGNISRIDIGKGILGNSVYNVFKDDMTQYYWIASLGGISVYDKEKGLIKNMTEKDGLPSHMVYSLLLNNDKVWISTTKGIAAVDRNDYSVWSLNMNEGWQATEFSEGSYYQDRKGTLFFWRYKWVELFLTYKY